MDVFINSCRLRFHYEAYMVKVTAIIPTFNDSEYLHTVSIQRLWLSRNLGGAEFHVIEPNIF
jgi:hypothetical protein